MPLLDFRTASDESYEHAEKWLDDLGVGGFIVFGGDEKTKKKLDALKRPGRGPAGIGPVIASDLERGAGQQIKGATVLPPLMALGASGDEKLAHAAGALTGREARAAGIDWVFAPVLDLADLPENPIVQSRAFGHDPALVTKLGLAWAQGLEEEGCIACAKHFPGHGATAQDSHDSLPRVARSKEALEARDLAPFRAAAEAGLGSFMTAHVAYPTLASDLPATIEPKIVSGILRSSWKYDGVVVTDALIMSGLTNATSGDEGRAAVLALEAGADVLLFPKDPKAVVRTVAAWARTGGQTARARIQDAVGRLLHMKRQLGLAGPSHFQRPARRTPITASYLDGTKLARKIADASMTRVGPAKPPLAKGQRVLVLALDDDGVEHAALELLLDLQEKLGEDHVFTATLGPEAKDDERERARSLGAKVDRVVLAVLCKTLAWKGRAGLSPAHAAFLKSLPAEISGKTTVVALASPWTVARACPKESEVLVAYGDDPASQRAAAAVLLGAPATGKVPVDGFEPHA